MEYALNEKKSSRRENMENLHSILGEAMNRDRTEQDLFQSALGCTLASPFADMLAVKKQWRKLGGRGGATTWCKASHLGKPPRNWPSKSGWNLAQRLLGREFQAVVSTHLNTRCVHNHIVCAPIGGRVNPLSKRQA